MPSDIVTIRGSPNGEITKTIASLGSPAADEISIRLTHASLCGTDLHYQHQDMCLGHEGIGIVQAIGSEVRDFNIGDRVGIGYQHSSCGRCKLCVTDHEPYCDQAAVYGFANHDLGTLSTSVLWSARHAYLIPSSIESADAAPLMCGGATVYAVLAKVHPGDTVGIVGVGGLGHLAIQFANKMGCEVIAFSRGESKREDAVKLGASTYVDAGQNVTDQLGGKRVNHLIVTSGQQPEWDTFLPLMAKLGCIHLLTVDMEGRFSVPFMPIIDLGLTISGSILAGSSTYEDMLAFAARHRIKPTIQRFSFDETGIKSAFEAMKDGSLRYRAVVEMNDS